MSLILDWIDKENSPELLAYLQQFSSKYYITAEEINELRDVINALYSGSGGSTVDKFYNHLQNTPSATWTIQHNLNKLPSISVVDSANTVVTGNIQYLDNNNVVITFNAGFSGNAYCN